MKLSIYSLFLTNFRSVNSDGTELSVSKYQLYLSNFYTKKDYRSSLSFISFGLQLRMEAKPLR
ncbi:MAG: hypothetical protein ACTH4W_06600, partial [Lactococcus lactis]